MQPAAQVWKPAARNPVAILSHLRWVSAAVVVLSHDKQAFIGKASYTAHAMSDAVLVRKDIFRADGYGHAAVVVFFVLSGFLVGGKLSGIWRSNDPQHLWPAFAVDRIARIFVVFLPDVLLSLLVCLSLAMALPHAPFVASGGWAYALERPLHADLDPAIWGGTVTLLNELVTPTITTNGPLWSLSYEWAYYVIALAGVLLLRRVFSTASVVVIAYGIILTLLAALNQPDVLFAGISWIAGWGANTVFERGALRGWLWMALGVAVVVAVLLIDHRHPLPDPVLGVALALMLANRDWERVNFAARSGERLASFSYSLYLTHFPIMLALMGLAYRLGWLPHPLRFGAKPLAFVLIAFVLQLLFARGFAWLTEDRTRAAKQWLTGSLGLPRRTNPPLKPEQKGVA